MNGLSGLLDGMRRSPMWARVAPYVVFLLLTSVQGSFGEAGRYWVYLAKTLVGAWMVWELRGVIAEMRWGWSVEAALVGVGVFIMWVALDPWYPGLDELMYRVGMGDNPAEKEAVYWNPLAHFGSASVLAWFFVVVRIAGSSLVVPALEEVFYRSFLYRYLISPDFEQVSLQRRHAVSMGLTCLIFAVVHQQWLAGFLCGLAYQWLVWRRGSIGEAMTAHAITNFLLGCWVVGRGQWQFW